ncbi:MBL fold metallo-hydrolase [Pseudothermotoga sp. U03pept]|uniref:MBL fold metallo-hydrolase n=1 Tax=Pseudothermotoga sp. U03pept TaxID=3447012 RepID=UPI003F0DDF99
MSQSCCTELTVLCNDELERPLFAEHGFSLLIEKPGEPATLFDTASTDLFIKNAKLLGKDLSKVENVVISHGHYDHAGGLKHLSAFAKNFKVFVREEIFLPKYSDERFAGVEWSTVRDLFDFVTVTERVVQISSSVYLFGPVEMKNDFEEPDSHFYILKDGRKVRDFFDEELNLVIDEEDGIILITGCAHRGIVNIVEEALQIFDKKIKLLLGGFHLYKAPPEKIEKVVEKLSSYKIDRILPYHCTGQLASERISALNR